MIKILHSTEIMQESSSVYYKIQELTKQVKDDFKSRGFVLPTKSDNNDVRIGNYFVSKIDDQYRITNRFKEIVCDNINLPQTALLLSNSLALNGKLDRSLLEKDQQYGFNSFDRDNFDRLAKLSVKKGNWNKYHHAISRKESAHMRADNAKKAIVNRFEKLYQFR